MINDYCGYTVNLLDSDQNRMGAMKFDKPSSFFNTYYLGVQIIDSTNTIPRDRLKFNFEVKETDTLDEVISKAFAKLIQKNLNDPRYRKQVLDFVVAATHGKAAEKQIEGKAKYWLAINELLQEGPSKEDNRRRAIAILRESAVLGYQPAKIQLDRLRKNKNLRVDAENIFSNNQKDDQPYKSSVFVEAAKKNADGLFGRAKVWMKHNALNCLFIPPIAVLVVTATALMVIFAVGSTIAAVAGLVALHIAFPHTMIPLDICIGIGIIGLALTSIGMIESIDRGPISHPYNHHLP